MSTEKGGIYQRGGFWLDYDRGAGGRPTSTRWYICWYDSARGRFRRKSTGTQDVRLACDKLDEHYLAVHRPTIADQATYCVSEAMTDYWLEHGQQQESAPAIKARLKLISRFMDAEAEADRLRAERRFALNPVGRIQTKKHRPVIPVGALFDACLLATDEWFVCSERRRTAADGSEMVIQTKVNSVTSGWDSAREALKIPAGWGPKLVRHSMATILANQRVDLIELEMALGHRVLRKTTSRYAIFAPDYLSTVTDGIDHVLSELARRIAALHRPEFTQKFLGLAENKAIENPANPLD